MAPKTLGPPHPLACGDQISTLATVLAHKTSVSFWPGLMSEPTRPSPQGSSLLFRGLQVAVLALGANAKLHALRLHMGALCFFFSLSFFLRLLVSRDCLCKRVLLSNSNLYPERNPTRPPHPSRSHSQQQRSGYSPALGNGCPMPCFGRPSKAPKQRDDKVQYTSLCYHPGRDVRLLSRGGVGYNA